MSIINGLYTNTENSSNVAGIGKTYIENLSPLKPLLFQGVPDNNQINQGGWNKGFPRLKARLHQKDMNLRLFNCKQRNLPEMQFVVAYGTIFQKIDNSGEGSIFNTLFITCESNNEITYIVDRKALLMRGIGNIIKKFLENPEYKGDIIYTDNVDSWCFSNSPKVSFKTFKDQRAYYQHLADEWVKNYNTPKPEEVISEEELEDDFEDEEEYDEETHEEDFSETPIPRVTSDEVPAF